MAESFSSKKFCSRKGAVTFWNNNFSWFSIYLLFRFKASVRFQPRNFTQTGQKQTKLINFLITMLNYFPRYIRYVLYHHCTSIMPSIFICKMAPIYHQTLFPTQSFYTKLIKLEPIFVVFPQQQVLKFSFVQLKYDVLNQFTSVM